VTAGTALHGSKLALTVWLWAAYLMATQSNGLSALQLQKQLGIGSYRSAWLLAAKLRRAMVDPDRNPLSGLIEVDEAAVPFRTKNDPVAGGQGRSHDGKLLIVGAVEVGAGNTPDRLRLAEIACLRGRQPQPLHRPQHRRREHGQGLGRLCRSSRRDP